MQIKLIAWIDYGIEWKKWKHRQSFVSYSIYEINGKAHTAKPISLKTLTNVEFYTPRNANVFCHFIKQRPHPETEWGLDLTIKPNNP